MASGLDERLGVDSQLLFLGPDGKGYLIIEPDVANCPLTWSASCLWGKTSCAWTGTLYFDFQDEEFNEDPPLPRECAFTCDLDGRLTLEADGEIWADLRKKNLAD